MTVQNERGKMLSEGFRKKGVASKTSSIPLSEDRINRSKRDYKDQIGGKKIRKTFLLFSGQQYTENLTRQKKERGLGGPTPQKLEPCT